MPLAQQIANQTQLPPAGVAAAVALFDEGATLPFVARYRKERTGGLDEVQLRAILDVRKQLTELGQRRTAILEALEGLGFAPVEGVGGAGVTLECGGGGHAADAGDGEAMMMGFL